MHTNLKSSFGYQSYVEGVQEKSMGIETSAHRRSSRDRKQQHNEQSIKSANEHSSLAVEKLAGSESGRLINSGFKETNM